jgi:hypothetical protein
MHLADRGSRLSAVGAVLQQQIGRTFTVVNQ